MCKLCLGVPVCAAMPWLLSIIPCCTSCCRGLKACSHPRQAMPGLTTWWSCWLPELLQQLLTPAPKPSLSLTGTSHVQDLIPYLVSHQQDPQPGPLAALLPRDSSEGLDASASPGPGREPSPPAAASGTSVSASFLAELSHTPQPNRGQAWLCQAYVAPQERLCIRASTLASYGDANRHEPAPLPLPSSAGFLLQGALQQAVASQDSGPAMSCPTAWLPAACMKQHICGTPEYRAVFWCASLCSQGQACELLPPAASDADTRT